MQLEEMDTEMRERESCALVQLNELKCKLLKMEEDMQAAAVSCMSLYLRVIDW